MDVIHQDKITLCLFFSVLKMRTEIFTYFEKTVMRKYFDILLLIRGTLTT